MARNSETIAAAIEAVNTIISEQNAALKALKDTLSQKAAGGGTGSSGIYMAKITPEEDLETLEITHNLGTTDILFAACWAETLGGVVPTFNGALGKYWAKTDIPARYAGTNTIENFDNSNSYNTTNSYAVGGVPTAVTYWDYVLDENTFQFRRAGSAVAKYITGVTYTVIIIAANAEV